MKGRPDLGQNKNHGRHFHGFRFAHAVHLTYALVGTGETYFAAFRSVESFGQSGNFSGSGMLGDGIPLQQPASVSFPQGLSFSCATSKLPSAIAAFEVLQNSLKMILDSSVSCSLLVDDSDSFLCGFDVCHNFFTPLFLISAYLSF